MSEKARFQLVNYFDVWGNEKDGWEVNNLCKEEIYIEIHQLVRGEDLTKEAIRQLKVEGFFEKHVRSNMLDFDWHEWEMVEFRRKNGKPLGRLELIRD